MPVGELGETSGSKPRKLAIQAINSFIEAVPEERAINYARNKTSVDYKLWGHVRHKRDHVEVVEMPNEATLSVERDTTVTSILGRKFPPQTHYRVIRTHPAFQFRIPEGSTPDEAPEWGQEEWVFSTQDPNSVRIMVMERQGSGYQPLDGRWHPTKLEPDGGWAGCGLSVNEEFDRMTDLINRVYDTII